MRILKLIFSLSFWKFAIRYCVTAERISIHQYQIRLCEYYNHVNYVVAITDTLLWFKYAVQFKYVYTIKTIKGIFFLSERPLEWCYWLNCTCHKSNWLLRPSCFCSSENQKPKLSQFRFQGICHTSHPYQQFSNKHPTV